jgi:hypothetical protein
MRKEGADMDTIFQWGLDFIIMIQQVDSPLLVSFFRAITSLGDESFYLLFYRKFKRFMPPDMVFPAAMLSLL